MRSNCVGRLLKRWRISARLPPSAIPSLPPPTTTPAMSHVACAPSAIAGMCHAHRLGGHCICARLVVSDGSPLVRPLVTESVDASVLRDPYYAISDKVLLMMPLTPQSGIWQPAERCPPALSRNQPSIPAPGVTPAVSKNMSTSYLSTKCREAVEDLKIGAQSARMDLNRCETTFQQIWPSLRPMRGEATHDP